MTADGQWRPPRIPRTGRRGHGGAGPSDDPVRPPAVGDECEAFLWGRLVEHLAAEGRSVPTWAWLNKLAHATAEEIEAIAEGVAAYGEGPEQGDWNQSVTVLAAELLEQADGDEGRLHALQHQLLVPFELAAVQSGTAFPMTPGLLVSITRAVLRRHPSVGI